VSRRVAGKHQYFNKLLVYINLICTQTAAKNRDDYEKLTIELTGMIDDLEKYVRESRSTKMSESVANVVQ
jgi:hypothetical protein